MLLRFFILNLWHFNYDVSWSGPFCINLVWDSLCFLDLHIYLLYQIREVYFIIFSNRFSIYCSFSSASGTPLMLMMDLLNVEVVPEAAYTIAILYFNIF